MHFVVDAQLPPALARWLIDRGHTANHVAELGLERAGDRMIWDRATLLNAVIVTKDEDFAIRKVIQIAGPAIVWIRFGNTTRPELLARLATHWPAILEALGRGDGLVEID